MMHGFKHHHHRLISQVSALGTFVLAVLSTSAAPAAPEKVFAAAGAKAGAAASAVASAPIQWAFYIIGALTVIGAVATITRRNPVVAAVCLVGTLAGTAGIYVLLHATFLAAMQVLVYAGAIMVLFIFVVMAVERPEEEDVGLSRALGTKVLGLVALGFLLARLVQVVMGPEVKQPTSYVPDSFGTVHDMGRLLFTDYLFPFEAISILLLVAIVGAVVVSRRRGEESADQPAGGDR